MTVDQARPRSWLLLAAAVAIVTAALATWYVTGERTLYRDDHVAYWSLSSDLARRLATDPVPALGAVARSVDRELNLLPALPIAVGMLIAGRSRLAYVLLVVVIYVVPAVLATAWVAARATTTAQRTRLAPFAVGALLLWLPAFLQPVLLGYLDAGGVALGGVAWACYLLATGEARRGSLAAVGAGLAAALLALFRRWYGIGVVGFVAAVAVDTALTAAAARRGGPRAMVRAARPGLITVATCLAALAAIALPRLAAIAATDYADRFAAWDSAVTPLAELVAAVVRYGALPLVVVGGLAVTALGLTAMRRPALLLLTQVAVSWLVFHRIQDPSVHHWYLWLPGLVIAAALTLVELDVRWMGGHGRLVAAVATGGTAVFLIAVLAAPPAVAGRVGVLGDVRLQPTVHRDLDEVRRLLTVLDERLALRPGPIYVLAMRGLVTDTSLGFANFSLDAEYLAPRFVLASAHVDRRDGFPDGLLAARYVLLPMPLEAPDPPVHHRVLAVPAAQILAGTGIGAAFRRSPERFQLEGGVTVLLYDRLRPSTPAEIEALSAELRHFYPDRPRIWQAAAATAAGDPG